jgi:hypothetical protein
MLHILVDALGDTTNDNSGGNRGTCSSGNLQGCDECLLVFRNAADLTTQAEVWGMTGDIIGSHLPSNTEVLFGFSGHRFYEWKIPLTAINVTAGQLIYFSSPRLCKGVSWGGILCKHAI